MLNNLGHKRLPEMCYSCVDHIPEFSTVCLRKQLAKQNKNKKTYAQPIERKKKHFLDIVIMMIHINFGPAPYLSPTTEPKHNTDLFCDEIAVIQSYNTNNNSAVVFVVIFKPIE